MNNNVVTGYANLLVACCFAVMFASGCTPQYRVFIANTCNILMDSFFVAFRVSLIRSTVGRQPGNITIVAAGRAGM